MAPNVLLVALMLGTACSVNCSPVTIRVVPTENTSCPWHVSLVDSNGNDGDHELCANDLRMVYERIELPSVNRSSFPSFKTEVSLPTVNEPNRDHDEHHSSSEQASDTRRDAPTPVPPRGYVQLSTDGYYKVHTRARSWFDAETVCKKEGGHLLVLDSVAEANAVRDLLASMNLVTERDQTYTLHAGFRRDIVTVLGTSLSYMRWDHSEPRTQFCGRIDNDGWLLYGMCSEWRIYVCEYGTSAVTRGQSLEPTTRNSVLLKDIRSSILPTSTPPPPPPPGKGYQPIPCCHGTYYKIVYTGFNSSPSWQTESNRCEEDGAHLPVIDSADEAEDVVDFLLASGTTGYFYLGYKVGDPITVLGTPMSERGYNRWLQKDFENSSFVGENKLLFSSPPWKDLHLINVKFRTICEINT